MSEQIAPSVYPSVCLKLYLLERMITTVPSMMPILISILD